MTKNQLQNIISELEKRNEKEDAYIGFYQYGGGTDESFIKANKEGLELYAIELLKASLETETEFEKGKIKTYGIEKENWVDEESEFVFDYVELEKEKRNRIKPHSDYKETWKDQVFKIGCLGVGIIILILVIVGFFTVINWI